MTKCILESGFASATPVFLIAVVVIMNNLEMATCAFLENLKPNQSLIMDGTGSLALEEEELTLPIAAVNKLIKEAVPKYRVSFFLINLNNFLIKFKR